MINRRYARSRGHPNQSLGRQITRPEPLKPVPFGADGALTSQEFEEMIRAFNEAEEWMLNQLRQRRSEAP